MIEFRLADGRTPNFHQGVITYRGRHVAVVALRDSAVLAIAEPRGTESDGVIESGPLTFVEAPDLVTALSEQAGFGILTAAELTRPFDAAAWPELEEADIRYWKPETVGDALFNYWD